MAIEGKAVMPLADYTAACEAIRARTGGSALITSGEMANAIASIPSGVDVSDTTATADLALKNDASNKAVYFYNKNGVKTRGSIERKAATTYNPSTSNQTISAGTYLAGDQTIRAVKLTNLTASNIRSGVIVKVGDAGDDDRITSVTGTYSESVQSVTYSFTGDGSSSQSVYYSAIPSSATIVAFTLSGTSSGTNAVYYAAGTSGSGTGVYVTATGAQKSTVTCSISTQRAYFSTTSPSIFYNGATYTFTIKYTT